MLAACVADGLVFVAGLNACDGEGLAASARVQPTVPYFRDQARAQMRLILDKAGEILKAAGSDLEHVVRVIQFHSGLAGVHGAHMAWSDACNFQGLPISAVLAASNRVRPEQMLIGDYWAQKLMHAY